MDDPQADPAAANDGHKAREALKMVDPRAQSRQHHGEERGRDNRPGPSRGDEVQHIGPDAPTSTREQTLRMLARWSVDARRLSKDKRADLFRMSMSPDQPIRRATIPIFMQLAGHDGILTLISLLDDPDPTIQGEAAEALGRLQATQAVDYLQRLLQHQDDEVVLRSAEALGRMGNHSGLGAVARVVRSQTALSHRAARTLGIIVGRKFRPNAEGVTAARRYLKANKL